jgi:uncharacterized FAD-dependent dehydrogenase
METKRYDLICIGAGPANLALAEEVKKALPDSLILVIDAGRSVNQRRCPLAMRGVCPPCATCHAVHGVAGAGAYSDGKVSFWPAGSGLTKMAPMSDVLRVNAVLADYYAPVRTATRSFSTCSQDAGPILSACKNTNIVLKPYDVTHAGSEAIQEFYSAKQSQLSQMDIVFMDRTRVTSITSLFNGDYFVAWSSRNNAGNGARAPLVSLGVGKASGTWLRDTLDALGVRRGYSSIESGVRLEFPHYVTDHVVNCHRDAKFKFNASDGSEVRTFCFCHRGFVLGAYYDDMTVVSGFSLRDRESGNTNFAILNRISLPRFKDPYRSLLPDIQAQNEKAGGGVTVQLLGDFIADRPTMPEVLSRNLVRPTLSSARPGRISPAGGSSVRRNIIDALKELAIICPGLDDPRNLVYGPVLEKCWDEVELQNMRTSVPGIYVVGDATGYARGLVQAAASGLLASRSVINDLLEVSV